MNRRGRSAESSSSSDSSDGRSHERGVASLLRLLVAVCVVCALALGGALVAPQALEGIEDQLTPSPSVDPPPAGDRNPDVTDPNDPGETTYETSVETISSQTVEEFVQEGVNERRAEHGLEPLEWDGTVASVSRAHSEDMHARGEFAHENEDGEGPFDRFEAVADYCQVYGENIAQTWVGTGVERPPDGEVVEYRTAEDLADGIVEQWMHSPPHRAAILETDEDVDGWDRGGVGVYITDEGEVFATHNFCTEW